MRLRIAHQLSLLITSAVVLAVLAVGGVGWWNLRSGFSDYLRQRDEELLTGLMQQLELRAQADPHMDWLRHNREAMRDLMDTVVGSRAPPPLPSPLPGLELLRPLPPPRQRDRPPPPEGPAGGFPQRVLIRDADGKRIAGRDAPPNAARSVRAIKVAGRVVATLELVQEPQAEGVDARFLQRQYAGLGGAALGTVLAALLAAWWVAGRWSRPLRELQAATRRIARGELSAQVPDAGASGLRHSGAVEIADLVADVNSMAHALAALEAARRTWIAEISHELRTPLAVLRGELEAIEDGARQPTAAVLASLRDEVLQLTRLVDDLHTLAVADLGELPCEFAEQNVDEALARMAQRFALRAAALGLELEVIPAGCPLMACWDFGRVEQLLSNLLENSLRYTQAPGRIRVSWRQAATLLVLTVEDSAPAVAQDQLAKLFEPLYRVDSARTRTGQHGSGLGLSIVRAIARAHRGRATAVPSPLGGLAVGVELPLQPYRQERRKTEVPR